MLNVESGAFEEQYSFSSRFENGKGTNPEELIGAAHAGCFSMALSKILADNGYDPAKIETSAEVNLEKENTGFKIAKIQLKTTAKVANIDEETFEKFADEAKENCPVSKALQAITIELIAHLQS
jgi:osmotically inducible protein OsmC